MRSVTEKQQFTDDVNCVAGKRWLNRDEYVTFARNERPHTRHLLRRWDLIYERYECDVCDETRRTLLRGRRCRDLSSLFIDSKYTVCVNINVGTLSDDENVVIHACNFLPVVIGTRLDIRLRAKTEEFGGFCDWYRSEDDDTSMYEGSIFMYGNFWIFNSFINTNTQLCHRYKLHNNSSDSCVRLYVYDNNGRGNMLFRKNHELFLRDSHKREVRLIDSRDVNVALAAATHPVVSDFSESVLRDSIAWRHDTMAFFHACFEYMHDSRFDFERHDSTSTLSSYKRYTDIDDIDNKRISSSPTLYSALLQSLHSTMREILIAHRQGKGKDSKMPLLHDGPIEKTLRDVALSYYAMSHRANLLRFISKKTVIRYDHCESMKRHLKTEMRITRHHAHATENANSTGVTGAGVIGAAGNGTTESIHRPVDGNGTSSGNSLFTGTNRGVFPKQCHNSNALIGKIALRRYCVAPSSACVDRITFSNQQQFFCPKIHDDVEYDHELIKRMRVINLNAIKCLLMPKRFERFLSFFNVGSISNAGRVMTRTVNMRETFFVNLPLAISEIYALLFEFFETWDSTIDDVPITTRVVCAINDVPVFRKTILMSEHGGDIFMFWSLFESIKMFDSSCLLDFTCLDTGTFYVNVLVQNDIPTCLVYYQYHDVEAPAVAEFCDDCGTFRTQHSSLTILRSSRAVQVIRRVSSSESALARCSKHLWCNRRELDLLQHFIGRDFPPPTYLEIACHGLLSVTKYPQVTDISKLIVSINAHRRSLRIYRDETAIDRAFRVFDKNGRANVIRYGNDDNVSHNRTNTDGAGNGFLRLFFAFGDFGMNNCEDGYVINENVNFRIDTFFCKKINVYSSSNVYFTACMSLEYLAHGKGIRLYVGTIRSQRFISFSINSHVYIRRRDDSVEWHTYDIYVLWNASFLQVGDEQTGIVKVCRMNDDDDYFHNLHSSRRSTYHARFTYDRGVIHQSACDVFTKYMRVKLHARNTKQTVKLQNSFGQKGMVAYRDLSAFRAEDGTPIDVVSSMYSLVGRSACGQFLEQRKTMRRIFSTKSGRHVGFGGYGEFFISDDSPHNNFIYSVKRSGENPMRMCRLTYESLVENDVSSAAFTKACEFESSTNNPYSGIPRKVLGTFDCYKSYGCDVRIISHRRTRLRKNRLDRDIVRALLASFDNPVVRRTRQTNSHDEMIRQSPVLQDG